MPKHHRQPSARCALAPASCFAHGPHRTLERRKAVGVADPTRTLRHPYTRKRVHPVRDPGGKPLRPESTPKGFIVRGRTSDAFQASGDHCCRCAPAIPLDTATKALMAPPVRFGSLLTTSASVVVHVSVYLTDTVRSQSFSLSQRFDPTDAWWPCFMPQPPSGFQVYRAFPARVSRRAFRLLLPSRLERPLTSTEADTRTAVGHRALLRPSVRHSHSCCSHEREPLLS